MEIRRQRTDDRGAVHEPRRRPRVRWLRPAALVGLFVLAACDALQVIESSGTAVTVRYDGLVNGLDDATPLAQRACAAHHKTAKLRRVYYQGLGAGERYAHFDCI